MRIAFLGSSDFSKIVLEKLLQTKHEIVCVVCNLDKESGRGHKVAFSSVKEFALQKNIPVLQYKSISKEGFEDLKALNLDVLVTASFGQILKENILNLAPYGVINVHASLLPKYRGSCPVNWAIINGEKSTGVTIMKTNIGLDTGDMILTKKVDIMPQENAGELLIRLAYVGADALIEALEQIENKTAKYIKQNENESSYYPMLDKFSGKIDFLTKTPKEVECLCRGLNPWPVCYVGDCAEKIKVFSACEYFPTEQEKDELEKYNNGQVVLSSSKKGLIIKCKNGFVLLDLIQAPSCKVMTSKAFLNGKTIGVGTQY